MIKDVITYAQFGGEHAYSRPIGLSRSGNPPFPGRSEGRAAENRCQSRHLYPRFRDRSRQTPVTSGPDIGNQDRLSPRLLRSIWGGGRDPDFWLSASAPIIFFKVSLRHSPTIFPFTGSSGSRRR